MLTTGFGFFILGTVGGVESFDLGRISTTATMYFGFTGESVSE